MIEQRCYSKWQLVILALILLGVLLVIIEMNNIWLGAAVSLLSVAVTLVGKLLWDNIRKQREAWNINFVPVHKVGDIRQEGRWASVLRLTSKDVTVRLRLKPKFYWRPLNCIRLRLVEPTETIGPYVSRTSKLFVETLLRHHHLDQDSIGRAWRNLYRHGEDRLREPKVHPLQFVMGEHITDGATMRRTARVTLIETQSKCAWELWFKPEYKVDTQSWIWVELQIQANTSWKGELEFFIEEFYGKDAPLPDPTPSKRCIYREVEIELDESAP